MGWAVSPKEGTSVAYMREGIGYNSRALVQIGEPKLETEAGDYKTTDDVITAKYSAESEHGVFVCTVVARREGLNTYADIEDVLVDEVKGCEVLNKPEFEVEYED